jgi:hypothetical protein
VIPIPSASSTIRFGWHEKTHKAINQGAIALLPENSEAERQWKQFLTDHFAKIMVSDTLQDADYEGATHFIDVAERGNETARSVNLYQGPGFPRWEKALTVFSDAQLKQLKQALKKDPLTMASLQTPPTLMHKVVEAYEKVVKQLRSFTQGLGRVKVNFTSDDLPHNQLLLDGQRDELIDSIGELTHYFGDTSMPLHCASSVGDWPLIPHPEQEGFITKDGIHFFIEKNGLSEDFHQRLVDEAEEAPKVGMYYNQGDLIAQVCMPQLINSYFLNGKILKAHQSALEAQDTDETKAQLREAFAKLFRTPLAKTQQNLALVLNSAWKSAGEPDIEATIARVLKEPIPEEDASKD